MKMQKLPIKKFCFVDTNGKRTSGQMPLQKLLQQTDFTDNDVENICVLPVGETVNWPKDPFGVRRIK